MGEQSSYRSIKSARNFHYFANNYLECLFGRWYSKIKMMYSVSQRGFLQDSSMCLA